MCENINYKPYSIKYFMYKIFIESQEKCNIGLQRISGFYIFVNSHTNNLNEKGFLIRYLF